MFESQASKRRIACLTSQKQICPAPSQKAAENFRSKDTNRGGPTPTSPQLPTTTNHADLFSCPQWEAREPTESGKDFLLRPIQDPCYLFVVDVSYSSSVTGLTYVMIETIRNLLDTFAINPRIRLIPLCCVFCHSSSFLWFFSFFSFLFGCCYTASGNKKIIIIIIIKIKIHTHKQTNKHPHTLFFCLLPHTRTLNFLL